VKSAGQAQLLIANGTLSVIERLHRNSPRQATQKPAVGDRDHRFSAGYPSFKKEGGVSRAGNIRPAPPAAILIFGILVILLRCPSGQHGVIERQEG
jgi:hypothetical protein